MMVLLELFISFLKIGFTSFGGLSMIPLITSEMTSHGWTLILHFVFLANIRYFL